MQTQAAPCIPFPSSSRVNTPCSTKPPSRLPFTRRGAAVGGAHAEQLLRDVLLPPLTWRAGKTAAAVRYAAITALATLLRRKLSPARPLLRLVNDGTLLPLVAQELDEDWWVLLVADFLGGLA